MQSIFQGEEVNGRGIPRAAFIEDVSAFLESHGGADAARAVFAQCQEQLSKYQYMLEAKRQQLAQLQQRLPDLQSSQRICSVLADSQENGDDAGSDADPSLELNFQLNDTLYTRASVPPNTTHVGLWLGADVMLEYPLAEALVLLEGKVADCKEGAAAAASDVEWLRENVTTLEVNCARLYNWDVAQTTVRPAV
ncbi:tubulin-binding prefolding complex subunit PAC10 KNAG_0K01910 [Huiozyma naganishii CBS 8797]|uniref:Prefoldin subunit 3 n=1 Tax=Huiozyma naganishii (strain ATCC MYA-139 / BCRC 22969 / CBS 8797 / KCTC 17520 / NBRC 10181 / NCYC 3082 / Yp74L-3) TaxID=1071383 RepID=J7RCG6_HUIN7|nr:hypothetical protein KNAG_0K01910 [Kazachstania naganishii CBS 8797]CCK72555.1 hypothetical protein KNAG_0K01910 [Kazachstania naganishii CBS 8797]